MYCSKGHENPAGSRFCRHCGERLDIPVTQGIPGGQVLSDRYVVIRQLGQGGFGRTYLAEDINRFREVCVLKEFCPQVQTSYVMQKAEELFQREASVLYKLEHPQIPRFRELFRSHFNDKEHLFLVQDYVEGQTYRALLEMKKQQGLLFTEAEVRQLLQQILPVLDYIHSMGVIHRDISPDNLILRNAQILPHQGLVGEMPVLIDFGGVKQVAAAVASQYSQTGVAIPFTPPTLLGKIGYAPPEQMQIGLVEPHSDLYALAATVLVLLTGKQPQELIDNDTLAWQWQREVSLTPNLGMVLERMLSPVPGDRYQNAHHVLEALNLPLVNHPLTQPPTVAPTSGTQAVSPSLPPPVSSSPPPTSWTPRTTLLTVLLLIATVGVGSLGTSIWLQHGSKDSRENTVKDITLEPTPTSTSKPNKEPTEPVPKYPHTERQRKRRLRDRLQQLDIDSTFYKKLVEEVLREKNPSFRGRTLSDAFEDERYQAELDKISGELLEKLALLSARARQKLGTYTAADRDHWKEEVNQIHIGSRSLFDLGDAIFFGQFPEQHGKNFINQPIGQVWQAFIYDKLSAIIIGKAVQKIIFAKNATSKTISGTLDRTDGKIFIAELAKNQLMNLKLQANPKILLSVYSPSGTSRLLEDSTKRNLSVKLPEDGLYEFVIVSTASEPINYQLNLTVENPTRHLLPSPTSTPTIKPIATPTPTAKATPKPIATPTPTAKATPKPTATPTPTAKATSTTTPSVKVTPKSAKPESHL
jgi:serine/threonine-protein kinase